MEEWGLVVFGCVGFIFAYIFYWSINLDKWKELKFLRTYVKKLESQISDKTQVVYVEYDKDTNSVRFAGMNKKIVIIDSLKNYKYDFECGSGDESLQKVIDWFISCTPDYEEK